MATPDQWFAKLARLHIYRSKKGGPAPHKPLLLLVVLELAEQGQLGNELALTPELAYRFCSYWSIVAHRQTQKPNIRLPFFHLKTDGFWSVFDRDGKPAASDGQAAYATVVADFLAFAHDPIAREKARRILIATYFRPDECVALYTLVGLPVPNAIDRKRDANYRSPEEARKEGRESRFRLDVMAAYQYTCALTAYRLTTISAGSIVDAAHIHPFHDSRNNDRCNGVALCKNAHWLFDNGLWTLSDDYLVIVAVGRFAEESRDQKPLPSYHGQRIQLPTDRALWPNPVYIAWHRKHRFQGP
jgi:putative restriction endonuclease